MALKHQRVERLLLFAAVLVLATACGDGELSGGTEEARLGPQASGDGEFDQPGNDAPAVDAPAIDAPGGSSDWWQTVPKPDATNTGPNCSAPGCPSATLLPSNAPPNNVTQDGAVYENFTYTGDEIYIEADNVTFRNFFISTTSYRGIWIDGTSTNLVLEYGEMVGDSTCNEFIVGQGWTGRYLKMHGCDDGTKIGNNNTGVGTTTITNSYWYDWRGGHGDAITLWPNVSGDVVLRHNVLVGGNTSAIIDDAIIAPASLLVEENWIYGGGAGWVVYCATEGGGERLYRNNLFDRNYVWGPVTDPGCTWINNLYEDDLSQVDY